ncbi:MAG: hypothetical protein KF780_12120 [Sphingomonas sp.]|nr:hypothetical protein [Sphingomonas sp.]
MNIFLATLAALSLFATPASYSPDEANNESLVHIPFDPPVNQPIRYMVEEIRDRQGTETRNGSIVTVEFQATEDGYRADFVHSEAPGMDFLPDLPGMDRLSELVRQPYSVRVSPAGEIIALEDEERLIDRLSSAMDEITTGADMPVEVAEALRAYVQRVRDMPTQGRLEFIMQGVAPIVGLGDVELGLGEALSVPIDLPTPFGPIPVTADLSLENIVDGVALVTVRLNVPSDEFRTIVLNAIEQLAPSIPAADMQRALTENPISMMISETYYISVDHGTLVRYEREKVASTEAAANPVATRDAVVIVRLD